MDKNEASKLNTLLAIASIDITLELDRILHSIMEITCFAMNAHSGTMMLGDETNGELKTAVSHGLGHDYNERFYEAARKAGVKLASGPQGTAIKTGKCCPVPNIFEEPGLRPWHDLSREMGFSSQIFAPLKKGNATAGMMSIHWAKPHQFTYDEINFLTVVASHAATVIQNAQTSAGSKNQIKELRGSEAKYRNIFEDANDCLYIHDAKGYFIEVNNASLRLLGCTREEIIGTHMSEWITPESLKIARESLDKGLDGGPVDQQMELEVISRNGEHKFMEIRRRLVKDGDRITAIHGLGRDITEKRKMDIIYRNTEKLIGLIKELIDIAHLEKNEFGLHFGLVSLNDIIARSINDIDQQAKEKDISIIRNIKKLPAIWGDEGRLSHVMTNLLNNAIKFTPSKGTVTIKAVEDAKDIKISVTDTGIGIPEDKLMRIFEKFYQIDGSSNRRYGGAGLGLSICKSIIENHYGSIWAESTGCGSTLNIVLPKLAHRKNKGR